MKANWGWLAAGVLLAVILYLIFRPVKTFDNSAALHTIDSLNSDNKLMRQSLSAQFNNFSHYKDSTTDVIDSLEGRNIDLKSVLNVTQEEKRLLAEQVLNAAPGESIDSPCFELARKVLSDSITIVDYQKNTDRLIFTFGDAVHQRDSLINQQMKVILSDSVVMQNQKALVDLQTKQLKSSQRQGKTSAWIARTLAVTALVLGGILLGK